MLQEISKRELKKLQTRKTISEIALKLFIDKGLNETTVAEIMERAALGTGTFYNYFESKEAILKYCLSEKIDQAEQTCADIQASALNSMEKLSQILQVIGKTHHQNRQLISLYMKSYRNVDKVDKEPPHGSRFEEILSGIILEGQEKNEFRKDIPLEVINEMFSSILMSTMSSNLKLSFMDNLNYKHSLLLEGVVKKKDSSA
ncbi:transcriptional regulator [Desulfosporosinus orientis DSM 765]|uniref:Transcriptional regulator n=1 Tax=Desulfosporosinus orientis (strain ATCC 19365 / DSM 765 / NCIMB 8382 / VKM B-1628 / Singapore I) TaxID=768706 RepID=G7WES5_DESOD|nr:TetR/AcrR family transcriptional regulator [Desulfosporosinus orientis]AET66966.1 transcriptional regulator [Desulfosporosinus orientis DSM 765]